MPKQRFLISLFLASLIAFVSCGKSAEINELSIIPEPVFLVQKGRTMTINRQTKLCFDHLAQNTPTAKYITKTLRQMHIRPAFIGTPTKNSIVFTLLDTLNTELGEEGYLLQVRPEGVSISANTEAGLFYGFQTFIQFLPPDIYKNHYRRITIPECTILDYPRFAWRGSHLDVSRHFFTVGQIKKHLDLMASYKLNKFHWHLTDDHGWRIEIDRYPQLTDIGAWRVDRSSVPWGNEQPARSGEEPTYGGYYTSADIAEVIEYAAQRHIEVIPEVELPGHCSAILAAYPELACDTFHYTVAIGPYWPPKAILCAGNDQTLQFLCDVMDEVVQLFPSPYIHIGGDEAFKDNWENCPRCQARRRQLGLHSDAELQGWLVRQVAAHLSLKGRRVIGWDEMLDSGPMADDAVVMVWRNPDAARQAVRQGHDAILCPTEYCYLDYYQADAQYQPPAFNVFLPMAKTYAFDPVPSGLSTSERQHILGGQANLWTEFINTYEHAEYMLLPRLCSLAECLWTPVQRKSWERFRSKIEYHKDCLRQHGYNVCNGSFKPVVMRRCDDGECIVTLSTEVKDTYIYFTIDGTDPTPESALYTEPLRLPVGTVLRTLVLYHGEVQEGIYEFRFDK